MFTNPNPTPNRVSDGSYGVLYVSGQLETAVAEISHHLALFLSSAEQQAIDVVLRAFEMRVEGHFFEVRHPRHADSSVLDSDDYASSIRLDNQVLQSDADGVVYPSNRHKPGILLAVFKPRAITNVRAEGEVILHWDGINITTWTYRTLPSRSR